MAVKEEEPSSSTRNKKVELKGPGSSTLDKKVGEKKELGPSTKELEKQKKDQEEPQKEPAAAEKADWGASSSSETSSSTSSSSSATAQPPEEKKARQESFDKRDPKPEGTRKTGQGGGCHLGSELLHDEVCDFQDRKQWKSCMVREIELWLPVR